MQACFHGVVFLLLWSLARCSSANMSGAITEEAYLRGLQIQPAVEDGQLVVTVKTSDAPNNLRAIHRVSIVTHDGEHAVRQTSGLLGVSVKNRTDLGQLV